jgi:predicted  nucleic acid-binding Zn-ribbon protein
MLPSPVASPDLFGLDDAADAPVPPRLDAHALDLIMAGREPYNSTLQLQSDLARPKSTPSRAHPHPRRPNAAAAPIPHPPPQDLFAALAANPSPPRPRPTHRLVPLTTAGLSSHLEALVSSHVAEAASYKSRVASLKKSLKARDEEIGALSAGLKQVKGEREALEQQVEEGKQEIEGWKGKVNVLREVRRGLLSEVKERDERITQLEQEKERWEHERKSGEEGDVVAATEDDSSRHDAVAGSPTTIEDIEPQKDSEERHH